MSVNVKKRVHVSFFFRLLRNVKKNFFSRYKILDNVKRIRFGLICGLTIILIFFCFYLVNPFFNGDAVFSSYGFFFFGIVFCIFVYYGTKRKCFESFSFDFKNDFFFSQEKQRLKMMKNRKRESREKNILTKLLIMNRLTSSILIAKMKNHIEEDRLNPLRADHRQRIPLKIDSGKLFKTFLFFIFFLEIKKNLTFNCFFLSVTEAQFRQH